MSTRYILVSGALNKEGFHVTPQNRLKVSRNKRKQYTKGLSRMNTEMIAEMLKKDQLEWGLLTSILDSHPLERLHDPNSPAWVSRDVYAHLARWISYSNRDMEAYCTGAGFSPPSINTEELNSRWQQEDSRMTLSESREKAHEAFNQRLRMIQSISLGLWDKELERIAQYDGAQHFALHRGYICVGQ
jgi:hypothetical protein